MSGSAIPRVRTSLRIESVNVSIAARTLNKKFTYTCELSRAPKLLIGSSTHVVKLYPSNHDILFADRKCLNCCQHLGLNFVCEAAHCLVRSLRKGSEQHSRIMYSELFALDLCCFDIVCPTRLEGSPFITCTSNIDGRSRRLTFSTLAVCPD